MKENKRIISWIAVFALLFSMVPHIAFAGDSDGTSVLNWKRVPSSMTIGTVTASMQLTYSGVAAENVVFESSDESILPNSCIWISKTVGANYYVSLAPIKEGTVKVSAYDKNNKEVRAEGVKEISVKQTTT
ncbi:hypothetical protein LI291_14490, partial [Intestinibacillus massiliensis]|nr:hypothetical protein [Intestinibacillus massiliensis]